MKKILAFLIGLGIATAYAIAPLSSPQIGYSPLNGYVLQTNGTTSTWVATSSLGIGGGGAVTFSYGSSTYYFASNPSGYITSSSLSSYVPFTYASTTFPSFSYGSTTYYLASNPSSYITLGSLSNNAIGLTYNNGNGQTSLTSGYIIPLSASTTQWSNFYNASSTLPYYLTFNYASTTFPSFGYGSTTYYLATNPSGFITNSVSNLTNYPNFTYASTTFPSFSYASSTFASTSWILASFPSFTYASSTFASTSWVLNTFAPLASPTFTGTINFTNASGTGITATHYGTFYPTGLSNSFLAVDINGKIIATTTPSGSGSSFSTTSINGLATTTFNFSTSSDTNIGLNISTSTTGLIFSPTWISTLADGRIASASIWNAKLGQNFSIASGTGLTIGNLFSTSTFNFLNASGTGLTSTNLFSSNFYPGFSNSFVSVDQNGKLIATTTPGGTTYTGTYPIIVNGSVISSGFSTSTINNWIAQNNFTTSSSTGITGGNIFATSSIYITNLINSYLSTDGTGKIVATTTFPGGGLSGGITGSNAFWSTPTTLGNGAFKDDGTVTGVNGTSSNYSFSVKGVGTTNLVQVASSSGNNLFSIASNGSIAVNGTSSGAIGTTGFKGQFVVNVDNGNPLVTEFATRRAENTTASLGSQIYWGRQRGTLASPSVVQSGDTMYDLYGYGYDGIDYSPSTAIHSRTEGTILDNKVPGVLTFDTASSTGILYERLRINSYGNISIGTTTGIARLYIQGTSTAPTDTLFNVASSSGQTFFNVEPNGTVGVATTSGQIFAGQPAKMFVDSSMSSSEEGVDVSSNINDFFENNITNYNQGNASQACQTATNDQGTVTTGFISICANGSNFNNPQAYNTGGAGDTSIMGYSTGDMEIVNAQASKKMYFLTGGSAVSTNARMTIDGNGNVGIGTQTPLDKLSINGNFAPSTDLGGSVGSSSLRFLNIYGQNHYGSSSLMTNATSTNFFATTSSSTNLYSSFANIINATTSTLFTTVGSSTNFRITNASTTNLSLLGNVYDSVNASGNSGQVLQSNGNGTVSWVTNAAAGVSGSGTNGINAIWTSSSNLAAGAIFDNGLVTGVNATSSNYEFTIKAGAATNPLNIASSSGVSFLNVDTLGNINMATTTATTTPTSGLNISSQTFGGLDVLSTKSFMNRLALEQNAHWYSSQTWFTPGIVAAGLWQNTVGANLGTAALVVPTVTGNPYTSMRRSTFASVVTTNNQQVGTRSESIFYRGRGSTEIPDKTARLGGFFFTARVGLTTWTANDDLFVGMSSCTTACLTGTTTLTNLVNSVGFGVERGTNALVFLNSSSTGIIATTSLPTAPALASNNVYDMYLYQAPNDYKLYWQIDNASTSANIGSGVVTNGRLPATTTLMAAHAEMGNGLNATVGAATLGVGKIYIETER